MPNEDWTDERTDDVLDIEERTGKTAKFFIALGDHFTKTRGMILGGVGLGLLFGVFRGEVWDVLEDYALTIGLSVGASIAAYLVADYFIDIKGKAQKARGYLERRRNRRSRGNRR